MRSRTALALWMALGSAALFLILLSNTTGSLEKWLWMKQLGYASVFWEILAIQWALFGVAFLCVLLSFWVNLRIAARTRGSYVRETWSSGIPGDLTSARSLLIALVPAVVFALIYYPEWDTYLRFRWGGSVGETDPIFHKDIGFYLFRLPFYQFIQNGLTGLTVLLLLVSLGGYLYQGAIQWAPTPYVRIRQPMVTHLSVLFLILASSMGWGFYLDRFELLYASRGVVYGMGYTDAHATLPAQWAMFFASIALGVLVLTCLLARSYRLILVGVGGYFACYFVLLGVLPPLVQKYKVAPNELELETPYLKSNIHFTRRAFGLDRIMEKTYPSLGDLQPQDIVKNQETMGNIRLWDPRPLLETYRQTQEFRLYYRFYDVDVDRYRTEDGYHQVMLSARELAPELPEKARTWVNQHLQFTHGYGMVMNFVSKKDPEGFPEYIIKNIPPESLYNLSVEQPAVYFGQKTPGYRIVGSGVEEFDYPKGDQNVYTTYRGRGGILLDAFWKRLLFAWTREDINILLTGYLDPQSRIQIWRNVEERASKIAPFLELDADPYLVLSQRKLYWIQDAYTVSGRFPYSEPYGSPYRRLNYIRNSVKIVIDAYEGSVLFFIADADDPVLRVYRQAFPDVFKDLSDMPEDLQKHLRYPEDLFSIQAQMYRMYHMVDPQVFYNQEDLWSFSQEKYAGTARQMVPYYVLMRLPDTGELQYLLMTPFTPQNRDNMIAWMAAKCDLPGYGQVLVYRLSKDRLTFGPMQVEAMIDQTTVISEQLTLWDQRGSRVIRGNLIVIPVEESFLYVEPVYLTAEGTNIPQLKRVIVVSGNKVVMEPTLEEAIQAVLAISMPEEKPRALTPPPQSEALTRARQIFKRAEDALRQGKWEDFGKAMDELRASLGQ